MRLRLSDRARKRLRTAAVAAVVIGAAAAGGRVLIDSANEVGHGPVGKAKAHSQSSTVQGAAKSTPALGVPSRSAPSSSGGGASAPASTYGAASSSTQSSAHATTLSAPVQPVGPDIVRSATAKLRVGRGTVATQMSKIAALAAQFGGYVNSSSLSGGSAKSAPSSGQVVVLVESGDFTSVLSELSVLGRVTSETVSGQDVTGQIAKNAATISVLQQEVDLLQSKLSEATDINTFLQIEGQLAPVQQQLQQLQSQQSVLQSSVVLSTITVNLTAPGAPIANPHPVKTKADAAEVAWRYLNHNTLFVLDGLAVVGGWALPLLVLFGLGWLAVTKVLRRKRPGISPA